jgi:hypothetical protein
MIAAMDIQLFHAENTYMCKPIRNKIMTGGMFYRIIYSTDSVSMNGIYIAFELSGNICEIFPSKFKIQFGPPTNTATGGPKTHIFTNDNLTDNTIRALCDIEKSILSNITIPGKTPLYKLHDQLIQNNFKFFWLTDNTINSNHTKPKDTYNNNSTQKAYFVLKISGCWTTPVSYGITYKFSRVKSKS